MYESDSDTQTTGVLYYNTVERRRFIALYRPFDTTARVILLGQPGQEQYEVWQAAQEATPPHEWADIRVMGMSAAKRAFGPLVRPFLRSLEARRVP